MGAIDLHPLIWLGGITLLSTVCIWGLLAVAPWEKLVPDFICYWTAAKLIASGQNPYDLALQTQLQRRCGWDKATDGLGKFDCLPYYYPPWFAAFCALLLPLGYQGAKIAWFYINLELLLLTGYLLRDAVPGLPRSVPLFTVPVFILSVISLFVGQTSIGVFFLVAVTWKLLAGVSCQLSVVSCQLPEGRTAERPSATVAAGSVLPAASRWRDGLAGAALAGLTTKPQVTAVLVLALLLWTARRRRYWVAWGFGATLAMLAAASALFVPWWPLEMVRASQLTPPPTAYFPWIGTTWFLILKTFGLSSWGLWGFYVAVAAPFFALDLCAAVDRSRGLADVIALGLLAPFIVAPYGRHYDFPVLLIPLFVLMARRLSEVAGALLFVVLMIVPYLHFGALIKFRERYPGTVRLFPECTFFWIPLLLTLVWLATEVRGARAPVRSV
jgi:hypothetical protein